MSIFLKHKPASIGHGLLLLALSMSHFACADIFLAINPDSSDGQLCSGIFLAEDIQLCRRESDGALGAFSVMIEDLVVDSQGIIYLNGDIPIGTAEVSHTYETGDPLSSVTYDLKKPDNTLLKLSEIADIEVISEAVEAGDADVVETLEFISDFELFYKRSYNEQVAEEGRVVYGIDHFFECVATRPENRELVCATLYDDDDNGTLDSADYVQLVAIVETPEEAEQITSADFNLAQYYDCSEELFNTDDTIPITIECRTLDRNNSGTVDEVDLMILFDLGDDEPTDNTAPIASAGEDQEVSSNTAVILDGSTSYDVETSSENLGYLWEQLAGTEVEIENPSSSITEFDAPTVISATPLLFRLTVSDADGLIATDSVIVTILPKGPIAKAGQDKQATSGDQVSLDGSSSTGSNLTYSWSQTAGTSVTLSSTTTAEPIFTAPDVESATVLTFMLTVTDSNGQSDSDTVDITVSPSGSTTIQANAGEDAQANSGDAVTLSGTNSVGEGLEYEWEQTAGTAVTLSSTTTAQPVFIAPDVSSPTLLQFRLTVTDSNGNSDSDTVDITILPAN